MSAGLAARLRTETRALHAAAEQSAFMQALLQGRLERPAYRALLRNLQALYAVLEPALSRHASEPLIAPVFEPALFRSSALAHDLHALREPASPDAWEPMPAVVQYVDRLHALDAAEPGLLLAHAYVRYLGDLSGGQMLRRVVAGSAAIGEPGAVAFYDFGDAARVRSLARAFRQGLASLHLPAGVADAVVAEGALAFTLHGRLFDELAAAFALDPPSAGRASHGLT